jgi:hypothetical protein
MLDVAFGETLKQGVEYFAGEHGHIIKRNGELVGKLSGNSSKLTQGRKPEPLAQHGIAK